MSFTVHNRIIATLALALCLVGGRSFAANTSATTVQQVGSQRITLNTSGGLVNTSGFYGGVFLVGVAVPIGRNSPVRMGLDTGVMFGSGAALPILLSMIYETTMKGVRPYIGGAIGPVIGLGGSSTVFGVPVAGSFLGDGVKLAILIRPGVKFDVTEKLDLTVETALGGLTGHFYIAPSLGVQLKLG